MKTSMLDAQNVILAFIPFAGNEAKLA